MKHRVVTVPEGADIEHVRDFATPEEAAAYVQGFLDGANSYGAGSPYVFRDAAEMAGCSELTPYAREKVARKLSG